MNDSKFLKWLFETTTGQTFIVLNGFFILLILKCIIEVIQNTSITFNTGQVACLMTFILFDVIFFLDFLSHLKDDKNISN